MSTWHIGIDPGQSGGIAILTPNGGCWGAWKMPATERDVIELLSCWSVDKETRATIERVHAFPGQGVLSSFKFGVNYGGLRMALIATGIPFEEVTPRKWQKAVGIISKKTDTKVQHKNKLKAKAQQLFPGVKVTLATADALLIAEYGRRVNGGVIHAPLV